MESNTSSLFLRACRGEAVERPPVWLMRQAGRYLPQYREIRQQGSFQDLCLTPELAAQVSLLPYEILGVDAVIVFSDLLTPLHHVGIELSYDGGPKIDFSLDSDLKKLKNPDFSSQTLPTPSAIRQLRGTLPPSVPVLGFAGAPFTLACYLIEGQGSTHFSKLKKLFFTDSKLAHTLFESLSQLSIEFLSAQIEAGAQAIQLFDTWAGLLAPHHYATYLPIIEKLIAILKERYPTVPIIYFVNGMTHLVPLLIHSGADILSCDWRVNMKKIDALVPSHIGLQGNLDPILLLSSSEKIVSETSQLLEHMGRRKKYICNLGHGILPSTPPEAAKLFVNTVRNWAPS